MVIQWYCQPTVLCVIKRGLRVHIGEKLVGHNTINYKKNPNMLTKAENEPLSLGIQTVSTQNQKRTGREKLLISTCANALRADQWPVRVTWKEWRLKGKLENGQVLKRYYWAACMQYTSIGFSHFGRQFTQPIYIALMLYNSKVFASTLPHRHTIVTVKSKPHLPGKCWQPICHDLQPYTHTMW